MDAEISSSYKSSSDLLALPLYLTNALCFDLFFWVVYFLLTHWREKIRTSMGELFFFKMLFQTWMLLASLVSSFVCLFTCFFPFFIIILFKPSFWTASFIFLFFYRIALPSVFNDIWIVCVQFIYEIITVWGNTYT